MQKSTLPPISPPKRANRRELPFRTGMEYNVAGGRSKRKHSRCERGVPTSARCLRGVGKGLRKGRQGEAASGIEERSHFLISILRSVLSNSTRHYQRPPSRSACPTFFHDVSPPRMGWIRLVPVADGGGGTSTWLVHPRDPIPSPASSS